MEVAPVIYDPHHRNAKRCIEDSTSVTSDGRKKLRARAEQKHRRDPYIIALCELRGELEQSYRNAWYCAERCHHHEDGSVTSEYCKTRYCTICARIRMGALINRYADTLTSWADPHFGTVTIPNVGGGDLPAALDAMTRSRQRLRDRLRKRGVRIVGLWKLEITWNARHGTYHPHFHFIVETGDQARAIVDEWLRTWTAADPRAQDIRPADPRSMVELMKYSTKPTYYSERDRAERYVPAAAMDVIYRALYRRRTVQPVGFKVPKQDVDAFDDLRKAIHVPNDAGALSLYSWDVDALDWVNHDTGECLSGYEPTPETLELVSSEVPTDAPTPELVKPETAQRQAETVETIHALTEKKAPPEPTSGDGSYLFVSTTLEFPTPDIPKPLAAIPQFPASKSTAEERPFNAPPLGANVKA